MIATKVNTKDLGFMATQYEKYGCITATEVINAFIDEQLEIGIEMLRDYNEYLSEHGYELYFSMESLDEMLSGYSPLEIIKKHITEISAIQMNIVNSVEMQILTVFQNIKLLAK